MDGFERFWDTNRDGHLDFVETAIRDEFYMKELNGKSSSFGDDDDDDLDEDSLEANEGSADSDFDDDADDD